MRLLDNSILILSKGEEQCCNTNNETTERVKLFGDGYDEGGQHIFRDLRTGKFDLERSGCPGENLPLIAPVATKCAVLRGSTPHSHAAQTTIDLGGAWLAKYRI